MNKLVNAREAANLLGVCAQTIYQKFEREKFQATGWVKLSASMLRN